MKKCCQCWKQFLSSADWSFALVTQVFWGTASRFVFLVAGTLVWSSHCRYSGPRKKKAKTGALKPMEYVNNDFIKVDDYKYKIIAGLLVDNRIAPQFLLFINCKFFLDEHTIGLYWNHKITTLQEYTKPCYTFQDYTPEAELLQLLDSISEKFPDITMRWLSWNLTIIICYQHNLTIIF